MLWLTHHHFTDDESLNFTFLNNPFAINGTLYVMYLVSSGKEGYPMYRLDPTSLSVQKISVVYENFKPPLALTGCILVYQKKLIIWNARDRVLYTGEEDAKGFTFREMRTRGDVPDRLFGFAYCLYKGDLLIHGGLFFDNRRNMDTFELNCTTMIWSRKETFMSEEIRSELSSLSDCLNAENLVVRDKMHVIGRKLDTHFILDLSSNVWSRVRGIMSNGSEMPVAGNTFVYEGSLYFYGRKAVEEQGNVYRFDEKRMQWKEVLSSSSHRLPKSFEHVVVAGSKVYFMKDANIGLNVTTLISVLEMNPTLFQRSAPSLRRSRFGRSIVKKMYPKSVNEQSGQNEESRNACQLSHVF